MSKRSEAFKEWSAKQPHTTYWFTQGLEGASIFIGAGLGMGLGYGYLSGPECIFGCAVLIALGLIGMVASYWWLTNQLLKEKRLDAPKQ